VVGLNRIYQGRVQNLSIQDAEGNWSPIENHESEESHLWQHHEIFQAAVNYYLVAICALVGDDTESPVYRLKTRLAECWGDFSRSGKKRAGLRAQLKRWLNLEDNSTLEDAFQTILNGDESSSDVLAGSLKEFMESKEMKGGQVRNASKNIEWFVKDKHNKNYPTNPAVLQLEWAKPRIKFWIEEAKKQKTYEELQQKLQPQFFSKLNANAPYLTGVTAVESLQRRLEEYDFESKSNLRAGLLRELEQFPERFEFPNPSAGALKGVANKLFSAFCFFKYLKADSDTFRLLSGYFKSPSDKEIEKYKAGPQEMPPFEVDSFLKRARGVRGFIFPAFTALPAWKSESLGKPSWISFDMVAFQEALMTVNQYKLKTKEREDRRKELEEIIRYQEEGGKPPAASKEEGADVPPTFCQDPRFSVLQELLNSDEMNQSETARDSESKVRGIYRSSLRGFNRIRDGWIKLRERDGDLCNEASLLEVVTAYQLENPLQIGDVNLFRALCQRRYWPLWQKASEDFAKEVAASHWSEDQDFLYKYCQFLELKEDVESLKEPIRFTPADSRQSRRLFMFTDISSLKKCVNLEKQSAIVTLTVKDEDAAKRIRVELNFSAPRLLRDGLETKADGQWIQPMVNGLGLEWDKVPKLSKDPAMELMPDWDSKGNLRMLLNFPVEVDPEPILREIGKRDLWSKQFNTFKDKNHHLDWDEKTLKKRKVAPWWKNDEVIRKGVRILGVDLGQRVAAATARIHAVFDQDQIQGGMRTHLISIGSFGEKPAWAVKEGEQMIRLPGEDAKLFDGENYIQEPFGSKGRPSEEEEWKEAVSILERLGINHQLAVEYLGENHQIHSFPEQNDSLIRAFRRALSRLRLLHRATCELDEKSMNGLCGLDDEPALQKLAKRSGETPSQDLQAGVKSRFVELRNELVGLSGLIANRCVPMRGKKWQWGPHEAKAFRDSGWYELRRVDVDPGFKSKIRGQRGLSIKRIEQLENLRKAFQSLNRMMILQAGIPAFTGKEMREKEIPEACADILSRLDRLKSERINQTAHLILAEALGLRLRKHQIDSSERKRRDVHGEYERIPGREPVDFIVIEDLNRYLSNQGRAPYENSRLMKWCHRAVRDKLVQLTEAFGIPVLEVPPAYSSRFHFESGLVGFRAIRISRNQVETERWIQRLLDEDLPDHSKEDDKNRRELLQMLQEKPMDSSATILVPQDGGTDFVAIKRERGELTVDSVSNADLNAASNLALSAIAAPQCFHVHRKIRLEKKSGVQKMVCGNKREKLAFTGREEVVFAEGASEESLAKAYQNAFVDVGGVACFDRIVSLGGQVDFPVATSRGLFGSVNQEKWNVIRNYNLQRLT